MPRKMCTVSATSDENIFEWFVELHRMWIVVVFKREIKQMVSVQRTCAITALLKVPPNQMRQRTKKNKSLWIQVEHIQTHVFVRYAA